MHVTTHISGSRCVVFTGRDGYIIANTDVRAPGFSFIEVVKGGQVRYSTTVPDEIAPECIVGAMRGETSWHPR